MQLFKQRLTFADARAVQLRCEHQVGIGEIQPQGQCVAGGRARNVAGAHTETQMGGIDRDAAQPVPARHAARLLDEAQQMIIEGRQSVGVELYTRLRKRLREKTCRTSAACCCR